MRTVIGIFLILLLLAAGAAVFLSVIFRDKRPPEDRRLCRALGSGDVSYLHTYMARGGSVNKAIRFSRFGRDHGPLLDLAIFNGRLEAVDFLLQQGANPNQRDASGRTPLCWAIGATRTEVSPESRASMVKRLLQAGADIQLQVSPQEGYTPLHEASFLGELEIVRILIAAGAKVDATDSEGLTPLHFAANAQVARLLIDAGAGRAVPRGRETPAQSAIRLGHLDALSMLTNTVAWTNATGPGGR